jgi:hypothetical protein
MRFREFALIEKPVLESIPDFVEPQVLFNPSALEIARCFKASPYLRGVGRVSDLYPIIRGVMDVAGNIYAGCGSRFTHRMLYRMAPDAKFDFDPGKRTEFVVFADGTMSRQIYWDWGAAELPFASAWERAIAKVKQTLAEAPLGNYELHGDWDNERHVAVPVIDGGGAIIDPKSEPGDERSIDPKGNSFASRFDRALVKDPRTEAALRKALAHLPQTFHLLLMNGEEGLRIAQSYLDNGKYSPGDHIDDALGEPMLKRLEALRAKEPDSVIILLTHNEGGKTRHPLTPWMIVHRLAHAAEFLYRNGKRIPSGRQTKIEQLLYSMAKCYEHPFGILDQHHEDQVLVQMCTFRSAREGSIRHTITAELGCEILTQYMMTGKVTLRVPETLKLVSGNYPMKNFHSQQAATIAHQLEAEFNRSIPAFLGSMSGRTFIC